MIFDTAWAHQRDVLLAREPLEELSPLAITVVFG